MRFFKAAALALSLSLATLPAHADDDRTWACTILLCLANPAGPMAAPACVSPIKRLWRHLARGRGFPMCDMGSNPKNYGHHEWASGENCPPGYQYYAGNDGQELRCRMAGAVTVVMDGAPFAKVWWSTDDESVTEHYGSPASNGEGAVVQESRVITCTEAASRPEFEQTIGAPNITGIPVPDGAELYRLGELVSVAYGGYANHPIYDGNKLIGYGYAKESRVVTKGPSGEILSATSWQVSQAHDCALINPESYYYPDPNRPREN